MRNISKDCVYVNSDPNRHLPVTLARCARIFCKRSKTSQKIRFFPRPAGEKLVTGAGLDTKRDILRVAGEFFKGKWVVQKISIATL